MNFVALCSLLTAFHIIHTPTITPCTPRHKTPGSPYQKASGEEGYGGIRVIKQQIQPPFLIHKLPRRPHTRPNIRQINPQKEDPLFPCIAFQCVNGFLTF